MLTVGLTGGIGSGKTLISAIFLQLGIPVYNADSEAKKIINSDVKVVTEIKSVFGENIYINNQIDRKKLASLVFSDKKNLEIINAIIHPAVHKHFQNWVIQQKNVDYVIEEAAILFESGAYKKMDVTINVHANELVRIARVVEREKITEEEVKHRIKNQLTDKERIKKSDFTIYNNGNEMLLPQILAIHQKIKEIN